MMPPGLQEVVAVATMVVAREVLQGQIMVLVQEVLL